jgi:glycosyltransferase involved in cell wall biosynthesis
MYSLVSIIIPTYNRTHLIVETLNSVLAQTYSNWECIIVDDHSTDNTQIVIKEFQESDSRFQFFVRPNSKNKGANSCRNYGIEKSKGNYIVFLDSDDLLASNCLENRISHFMENTCYDMLVFSMGHFEVSDNCYIDEARSVVNLTIKETIIEFVFGKKLPWNITRTIYKKEFLVNRIWLNEKMHNFQDDEFHIRILGFLKPRYRSIDKTDCYYRYDYVSVNKYSDFKGKQNILDALIEYYNAVFKVFDSTQKKSYREKLIQKLFNQIRLNVLPKSNLKIIKHTIVLFDKELSLTLKELFLLKGIMFLNYYYYYKKGYYRLSRILLKIIK